ncbi:MAG TPA: DNA polymerase Y family protein [Acidobacteriaceae bacterium]
MSADGVVYACIHAPEFPVQTLLRLRHALRSRPVAVLEGQAPLERVCAANPAARQEGVADGMTRVEVEAFAGLAVLRRSLREEAEARAALLACASRYTPSIEEASTDTAAICVLDLAGTEKLFGPPLSIARSLEQELAGFGMQVSIAISANFHASVALARSAPGICLVPPGEEQQALAPLPLAALPLSAEQHETLALWGMRTLGHLAALPERALIARMGQEGKRLRALARGQQPHLFQPASPAFVLRESYEFDAPVAVLDSLLFVLAPMLDQLLLRVRDRGLALACLSVLLTLERSPGSAAGREHRRSVRPALPTEDRKLLLKLLHLDLAAHPPEAAVLSLEVTAEAGRTSKVQMGLFSPQMPESSRLDVTLARLRALVGEAGVGSPQLLDTHAPEGFLVQPFVLGSTAGKKAGGPEGHAPAMRRIRPPAVLTVQVEDARPAAFHYGARQYQVVRAFGPWRESGSWWSAGVWSREQWDVIARAPEPAPRGPEYGAQEGPLYCRVAQDLLRRQWLLEAVYD